MAEALAVAAVVADHHGLTRKQRAYGRALEALAGLDAVHEEHVARYLNQPRRYCPIRYT